MQKNKKTYLHLPNYETYSKVYSKLKYDTLNPNMWHRQTPDTTCQSENETQPQIMPTQNQGKLRLCHISRNRLKCNSYQWSLDEESGYYLKAWSRCFQLISKISEIMISKYTIEYFQEQFWHSSCKLWLRLEMNQQQ